MRPNRIVLPQAVAGQLRSMRERAAQRATAEGREARPWYRIDAADGGAAVIYIYDEISWWGITARDFIDELNAINTDDITVHINSPGGWVDDGIAIYNALRDHKAHVTTINDAGAYSIASVIMQAGDTRVANRHSMMMIHDALTILDVLGYFNPADLEDLERDVRDARMLLDKTSDVLAGVYAERGGDAGTWRTAMRATTWYTAEEALAAGLVDELVAGNEQAANRFERSALFQSFRNTPEHLQRAAARDEGRARTKREAEQTLRDAGWSVREAKAALSAGASEPVDARDERVRGLAREIRQSIGGQ